MEELKLIISGVFLGVAAAISPGPILALMVSETLKYGKKEGIAVGISPIFTDIPIFLVSYFLIYKQSKNFQDIVEIFYLLGGILLIYLGYKNLKYHHKQFEYVSTKKGVSSAFLKGFAVNLFNPYTYLFWFLIAINFYSDKFFGTLLFFISFFIAFIGVEVAIIISVDSSKRFIKSSIYNYLIKSVGFILLLLGIRLIFEFISKYII
ncbi:MAG: LysE family transporter [Hydrogenothermaceae bacterium]|nr:LysE family transporter [Hydrogenothermaceae bacterium]